MSFSTPPARRGGPSHLGTGSSGPLFTGPVRRHKSASPWRHVRSTPYRPRNPLLPGFPTFAISTNPLLPAAVSIQTSPSQSQGQASPSSPAPDSRPPKIMKLDMPFSLVNDGFGRAPNRQEIQTFEEMFPTFWELEYMHPFLIIRVRELPQTPWPTMIAGMPLWLTTKADEPYIELGKSAHPGQQQRFTVNGEIKHGQVPAKETVSEIFKLANEKGAGINAIEWNGNDFRGFGPEEPKDWFNRLPSKINGFHMSYLWGEEPMEERALRLQVPSPNTTDDTAYGVADLRPGVLLSGALPGRRQTITTSGVCVKSPGGKKYFTVAAHGFTAGPGDTVYHPKLRYLQVEGGTFIPDRRLQIGEIEKLYEDTDIALATLKSGRYSRETFDNAKPFRNLKDSTGMQMYATLYMDTPVTGPVAGAHISTRFVKVDPEDNHPRQQGCDCVIIGDFVWFGQDDLIDGCCGGVIWDDDMDVVGQFRFQEKAGRKLGFCPSFAPLINAGYTLSSIE